MRHVELKDPNFKVSDEMLFATGSNPGHVDGPESGNRGQSRMRDRFKQGKIPSYYLIFLLKKIQLGNTLCKLYKKFNFYIFKSRLRVSGACTHSHIS